MPSKSLSATQSIRWALLALLAFACYQAFELRVKLMMLQDIHLALHPEELTYTYKYGNHPNTLPIRVKETAMEVEWLDQEVYGLYADEDWASLFPGDSGFVFVGPPVNDTSSEWDANVFAIGMFHQLHCLDVFRHSYVAAKAGVLAYPGNGTGFDEHINHCLSYMREMVLCAADTTLIHTRDVDETLGRGKYEATSIGTVHRCRDWTQVRKFVEDNKAPM